MVSVSSIVLGLQMANDKLQLIDNKKNIGSNAESHCGKKSNMWDSVKETVSGASKSDVLMYGVKTTAVAGAAVVATPLVLTAAGFGAGGITAGSTAAAVQATWFGATISGITGTVFSGLTSIGAAGLGVAGKAAIVGASGAAVKAYDAVKGGSDDKNCDCCTGGCSGVAGETSTPVHKERIGASGLLSSLKSYWPSKL